MPLTIVRQSKGIVAPVLPPDCYLEMHCFGEGEKWKVSRRIVSAVFSISSETVDGLDIPVAFGGHQGERTFCYVKDLESLLENLEEGLSSTWEKECLIKPTAVAHYLGVSLDGLRMMRYRGNGPACIRLTSQVIRFSKSSVNAFQYKVYGLKYS